MESNKKLKVKSFAGGGVYVFPNDGSESASSALPILKTKSALAGWHILTDRQWKKKGNSNYPIERAVQRERIVSPEITREQRSSRPAWDSRFATLRFLYYRRHESLDRIHPPPTSLTHSLVVLTLAFSLLRFVGLTWASGKQVPRTSYCIDLSNGQRVE